MMNKIFVGLIFVTCAVPMSAYCDDKFPYSAECGNFALKPPKRLSIKEDDSARGVGARESFETKGMQLHARGKWRDSNCYLIHALNISSDHSVNLINTVGFNYAALGNDVEALRYFEEATGFTWDLDNWLKHKAKPPFNKILNKPIYKNLEQSLYDYYKHVGLPVPQY